MPGPARVRADVQASAAAQELRSFFDQLPSAIEARYWSRYVNPTVHGSEQHRGLVSLIGASGNTQCGLRMPSHELVRETTIGPLAADAEAFSNTKLRSTRRRYRGQMGG